MGDSRSIYSECSRESEVYWVTYNLKPPKYVLEALLSKNLKLNIICQHPVNGVWDDRFRLSISKNTYSLLEKYKDLVKSKKGYQIDNDLFDKEERPGPLHAKFIVTKKQDEYHLVTGSFNLSSASLGYNCECACICNDKQQAKEAWDHAEYLANFSEELQLEDCIEEITKYKNPKPVEIKHSPSNKQVRKTSPSLLHTEITKPTWLKT